MRAVFRILSILGRPLLPGQNLSEDLGILNMQTDDLYCGKSHARLKPVRRA
jgi:hypothetical protein